MKKVFVTGISGAVGHYLFPLLENDYELYLLVRKPERLRFDYHKPNVHILQGNMSKIPEYKEYIEQADYILHVATLWGGPWAFKNNVGISRYIFEHANKAQKIIYFSTASLLGNDNQYIPEARSCGATYVRSKYLCAVTLPKQKNYDKIITLYPTWVYGGNGKEYPLSHASSGLKGFAKNIWWLKFFYIDYSFHFIHCYDIAQIVKYMMENKVEGNKFVLGNELHTAKQFFKEAALARNKKVRLQMKIPNWVIQLTIKILGKSVSNWDRYCMARRHFSFETVNAKTFGLPTQYDNVSGLLSDLDL